MPGPWQPCASPTPTASVYSGARCTGAERDRADLLPGDEPRRGGRRRRGACSAGRFRALAEADEQQSLRGNAGRVQHGDEFEMLPGRRRFGFDQPRGELPERPRTGGGGVSPTRRRRASRRRPCGPVGLGGERDRLEWHHGLLGGLAGSYSFSMSSTSLDELRVGLAAARDEPFASSLGAGESVADDAPPDDRRGVRRLRELGQHVGRQIPVAPAAQVLDGLVREVAVRQQRGAALQHVGLALAPRAWPGRTAPCRSWRGAPEYDRFALGQHAGGERPAVLRREQDVTREQPAERGRQLRSGSGFCFSNAPRNAASSAPPHTPRRNANTPSRSAGVFGSASSLRSFAASNCFAALTMSASAARANSKKASAAMVASVESRCLKKKPSFFGRVGVVELRPRP